MFNLVTPDYNLIDACDLGKGSNIKLERCETEHDLYWKMAIEVFDLIKENNEKGKNTLMVVPYGPLGPYARLAWMVNKYQGSSPLLQRRYGKNLLQPH